jgi:hypothetical protein
VEKKDTLILGSSLMGNLTNNLRIMWFDSTFLVYNKGKIKTANARLIDER